jgi:serine protease Do
MGDRRLILQGLREDANAVGHPHRTSMLMLCTQDRSMRSAVPAHRLFPLLIAIPLLAGCSQKVSSLPNFADLVEQVSPSVVNISAVVPDEEGNLDEASDIGDGGSDQNPDWLRRFLDQQKELQGKGGSKRGGAEPPPNPSKQESQKPDQDQAAAPQSLGSGFILSSDGYILTNQHVVKDAKEIIVRLSDRRELPAQLIGSDERSDLALLRIDAKDLPAVKLGDVSKLRVGEWVLAIGSPFGFDYSVTAGIVSAKGRSLDSEQYVPFIQTDAAINPGNSGGPLFNLRGEVVGINSQIYSQTGGFMGVAFSVPIDVAAKVVKELKEHGRVIRGWLGVVVQEIDRAQAQKLGLDKMGGALIAKIIANSPAEQAGLRSGDVILTYNGVELPGSRDLPAMVGSSDPGQMVALDVLRDGKKVTMKVEVGTLDDTDEAALDDKTPVPAGPPLGLSVQPLTDAQRRSAKVISGGVLVTDVESGPGRDAGVQRGDVILSIASQDVGGPERFEEVAGRLTPGVTVPMLVQRRGQPLFLQLQLPPKGNG